MDSNTALLQRKWAWLRGRATATERRPTDTATLGDAYERWYADYCATDRLDPVPLCQPGTSLWREMHRLARRA